MNQTCKVCGEPAAGFHFGAFTCEGCKSFFGRSYNNLNSISECKNNGECVINKKNRTACKACRLRKCVLVGMSKSGSRYGRRSNWFKIHCLLQEQQHQQQAGMNNMQQHTIKPPQKTPPLHHPPLSMSLLGVGSFPPPLLHLPKTKEELMLLGLDDYKHSASPNVSSPESHNSDSSVEVSDARRLPLFPGLLPPTFLPPPGLLFPHSYSSLYSGLLQPTLFCSHSDHRRPKKLRPPVPAASPIQEDPIDLSMKTNSERGSSPANSDQSGSIITERGNGSEADEESDCDSEKGLKRINLLRPSPLDLTTKV
ncbi:hypothetical protein NQ314_021253 [Rhamnusium bicolor]|uniref:Nuclear receptor domain-containing protein n=1 Tax=Rhamnusium bicolor TaxID=1586634 RepID=A0AAV8WIS8_9CUCU|nr:hypothetical protein NQ314_021253 [Rhamnusium bicolor]